MVLYDLLAAPGVLSFHGRLCRSASLEIHHPFVNDILH